MKLGKKGQSMVETALVLPIILLLLLGMVEFSRIFGSYLLAAHASREGARLAAVGRTDAEVIANVSGKVNILSVDNLQVTVTPEEDDRRTGDDVRVSVSYQVDIFTPIISSIIPDPFEMEVDTYMRVE